MVRQGLHQQVKASFVVSCVVLHEGVGGGAAHIVSVSHDHVAIRAQHLALSEHVVPGDDVGVELPRGVPVLILCRKEDGHRGEEAELVIGDRQGSR